MLPPETVVPPFTVFSGCPGQLQKMNGKKTHISTFENPCIFTYFCVCLRVLCQVCFQANSQSARRTWWLTSPRVTTRSSCPSAKSESHSKHPELDPDLNGLLTSHLSPRDVKLLQEAVLTSKSLNRIRQSQVYVCRLILDAKSHRLEVSSPGRGKGGMKVKSELQEHSANHHPRTKWCFQSFSVHWYYWQVTHSRIS